jgi:hypothetical protein
MNLRDLLADAIGYYDEPWTKRSFRSLYNERNLPENANIHAKQQELGTQEHAAYARDLVTNSDPILKNFGRFGLPLAIPVYDASKAIARNPYALPVLRDIANGMTGKGRVDPGLDSMASGYKGWRTGIADLIRGK